MPNTLPQQPPYAGLNRARIRSYAPAVHDSEEETMAVVAVFQEPSLTQEQYEESVSRLTSGKSRMESPSDWPVEGLLVHIAGEGENGFRVGVDDLEGLTKCLRILVDDEELRRSFGALSRARVVSR